MKKIKKFLAEFWVLLKNFQFIVPIALLILGTGCAGTGRTVWERIEPGCTKPGVYMGGSLLDPIPRSALPPDPVRRSETVVVGFDGYNYHHSQGTYNSAERTYDPYTGQVTVRAEQSTYNNTSESVNRTPRPGTSFFRSTRNGDSRE